LNDCGNKPRGHAIAVAGSIDEASRELINHLRRWNAALFDNSIQTMEQVPRLSIRVS